MGIIAWIVLGTVVGLIANSSSPAASRTASSSRA